MFEQFTKEARGVVVDAQTVARSLHTRTIDTRHLVVALCESDGGTARAALEAVGVSPAALAGAVRADLASTGLDADALAAVGIDLEEVRRTTDATFGAGALEGVAGRGRGARKHIPFTPDAKKTLELSLREAIRLGSKGINSGHLLLGILRSRTPATPVVEEALRTAGVDAPALRTAAEQQSRPA